MKQAQAARLAIVASSCLPMLLLALASAFQPPLVTTVTPSITKDKTTTSLCSSLTSTINVSENAQRDLTPLMQWAVNCGLQTSDGFDVRRNADEDGLDDACVTTNQDLPRDSPILFVPAEVMMTGQMARQELGGGASGAEQMLSGFYGSEEISKFYLFLKLLREFELGEASPYFQYLNSLPRFFSNGASMTDFCYGCLPPYAAGLALADKTRMKLFVQSLEEVSFLNRETKANEDITKWAFAVVNTRCNDLPNGDVALIPIIDYFNHGGQYEANAYLSYDEQGNCYAYSNQDISAGGPLLLSYGDSTNPSKLLARYGFLDESSPATYCKYIVDGPSEEMKFMGYPDKMLFYEDGGISQEVWDCVLYEQLDKNNSPQKQEFYQAFMSGDEVTKQRLHEECFFLTAQALESHVDYLVNELDELEIGIETQSKFGSHAHRHPRLPLLRRHNMYVKTILERVQENLSNMGR